MPPFDALYATWSAMPIHTPVLVDDLVDRRAERLGARDIECVGMGTPAALDDARGYLLSVFERPSGDGHDRSGGGETLGDPTPNTAASPGDNDHVVIESERRKVFAHLPTVSRCELLGAGE